MCTLGSSFCKCVGELHDFFRVSLGFLVQFDQFLIVFVKQWYLISFAYHNVGVGRLVPN